MQKREKGSNGKEETRTKFPTPGHCSTGRDGGERGSVPGRDARDARDAREGSRVRSRVRRPANTVANTVANIGANMEASTEAMAETTVLEHSQAGSFGRSAVKRSPAA